jgi:hypothetical protein
MAFGGTVFLALPFLVAREAGPGRWRDYAELFRQAWSIVVRMLTALLFVGLFWLVYWLSHSLLSLVDFDLLSDLSREIWFVFALSGLVLGLALSVLNELSAFISPGLVLQLLRLLLPVVTAVVALFILLVPFQGLEEVFGGLSAAATLLAMAVGGITLISSALDQDDTAAAEGRAMRGSAQALALLLPVLGAIAAYAIWLRVAQYGWTPPRLVAALSAGFVMAYALLYAGAVLLRRDWMGRIRRGNVAMALALATAGALWLTPLLNAERISAASQVARFEAGRTAAAELDLWTIGREWGRPGEAALARLAAMTDHPEAAVLAARIDRLETAPSRYEFGQRDAGGEGRGELVARISAALPLRPEGATLPEGVFDNVGTAFLEALDDACGRPMTDGRPGCAAIVAELHPGAAGVEVLVFLTGPGHGGLDIATMRNVLHREGYEEFGTPAVLGQDVFQRDTEEVIAAVLDGAFRIAPASLGAVVIGDAELVPRP